MNIYFSAMDIPEFQHVSVKEAKRVWRKCYRESWSPIAIGMACLFVGLTPVLYSNLHSVSWALAIFISIFISTDLSQPLIIASLRPKVRCELGTQKPG